MRGPAALPLVITAAQAVILDTILRKSTSPQNLIWRAKIIQAASQGTANAQIARQVGVHRDTARTWRQRWYAAQTALTTTEQEGAAGALETLIYQILRDRYRSGAPRKITPAQQVQIMAVACEPPADSGHPVTHWTPTELAAEVLKRQLVTAISSRTLGRYLAAAVIKPHLSRYWLHASPQDEEQFAQAVTTICDLYLQAQALATQGVRVISCDEKTSIQALERQHPTLPTRPGLIERREFAYHRHGTLCLLANFAVATGTIIAPSLGPTRKEADFLQHIKQTVALDPEVSWIFIVDQLNTHKSASLVKWVAAQLELPTALGKKGSRGILKSMATRQIFLTDPTHRIRFIYTPTHTSWLNQVEIWFSILGRRVLKRGSFDGVATLRQSILDFISYFNKALAKPFKWTFTGRVLTA